MQKLDLHVISIPDHKAQIAVAQLIVGADHSISLEAALKTAQNPPLLLYHNIEPKDAKQVISRLESVGVGFKTNVVDETADVANAAKANSSVAHDGFSQIAADRMESNTKEIDADENLGEFADIKAHNINAKQNAADTQDAAKSGAVAQTDQAARAPIETATNFSSGGLGGNIRIGANTLKKEAELSKKRTVIVTSAIIGVFIVLGLTMFFARNNNFLTMSQSTKAAKRTSPIRKSPSAAKTDKSSGRSARTSVQYKQEEIRHRSQVNDEQKQQANSLVDSAKTSLNLENSIAFYKIAISFNRYNLAAWQGLLQAYRELHRTQEAIETERLMLEIFGDEIMSVNALAKKFGDIVDAYKNDDGTYKLEYKTQKRGKDEIIKEVFNMTRAVRSACNCKNISIYAITGSGGKGLLVHSTPETSIHSPTAFATHAQIIWLE